MQLAGYLLIPFLLEKRVNLGPTWVQGQISPLSGGPGGWGKKERWLGPAVGSGLFKVPTQPPPHPLASCPNPIASPWPGVSARPGLPRPPQTAYRNPNGEEKREGGMGSSPHISTRAGAAICLFTFLLPNPHLTRVSSPLLKHASETSGLSHIPGSLGVCLALA